MKRLTYKTVGDANRAPHYCHGPGVKKDDLLQRLGLMEELLACMPEKELAVLIRDIRGHEEHGGSYGDSCDRVDWLTLLHDAEKEIERRGSHETS